MQPAAKAEGVDGLGHRFPNTSWTLLAKAREQCADGARAREDFARRYYRPVREFLLVLVHDPEKAADLSQEFFAKISAPGGLLCHASPGKGPFHNYLQQALRNLVIDHHRRSRKDGVEMHRGRASDGQWPILDVGSFPAAEAAFHRVWVKDTLAAAVTLVRALCAKRKQDMHFALFEARYLCETDASWEELGARYGLDQKAARERADTVVRHFRLVLRRMLRNEITVPGGAPVTEAAIDEEIQVLLSPMRD